MSKIVIFITRDKEGLQSRRVPFSRYLSCGLPRRKKEKNSSQCRQSHPSSHDSPHSSFKLIPSNSRLGSRLNGWVWSPAVFMSHGAEAGSIGPVGMEGVKVNGVTDWSVLACCTSPIGEERKFTFGLSGISRGKAGPWLFGGIAPALSGVSAIWPDAAAASWLASKR